MSESFDPVVAVQQQLEAYNARDLQRFVDANTDDVEIYRLPGAEPVLVGKAALAEHYRTKRFNRPDLHAEVVQRMVLGNTVIDHERVTGLEPMPVQVAAIYEVTSRGIRRVWFVGS